MDTQQVIRELEKIVGPEQILTDPEDLYVYSFERIFEKPNPRPDIIVRTISPRKVKKILELADQNGFKVVKRSESIFRQSSREPMILLDDIQTPELRKPPTKEGEIPEILREIQEKGHGSPRNFALALRTLFLKNNLADCGECKICSGYCTVASSFGGVETWSSKGRILTIRGLQNEELSFSEKTVNTLYSCTECGLCFSQCYEGLQVHKAILVARNQIAEKDLAPEIFKKTARNIMEVGDPGAVSARRRLSWMKHSSFEPSKGKAELLYWVGCMVADRTPKTAAAFLRILNQANVDSVMLNEKEGCCGYILLSTGLWKEARHIAKEALEKIERTGAETLVTPCAGCYYAFKKLYPEILGVSLPCGILHSSELIAEFMRNRKLELKSMDLRISYHDPCSLGRHSQVFETPRKVLKSIPELELLEMPLNRQLARCCGGGGGLWSFNHQVCMNSANSRLKDLQPLKVDVLTTACPLCQINLRYTCAKSSIPIKVCDISEIVNSALN